MTFDELTIENIANGALPELFNHELDKIIKNIRDINTECKTARELKIVIKMIPDDEREVAATSIQCSSKLAPIESIKSTIFFDDEKAYNRNMEEQPLFNDNVKPFKKADEND